MSAPDSVQWRELRDLWQTGDPPAAADRALRARVRRDTTVMRLVVAGEALVLTGLAWLTPRLRGSDPTLTSTLMVAVVWLLAAGLAAFAFWNRRGSWKAAAETTGAFLLLARRRARARLRVARAVRWLAVAQCTAVLGLATASGAAGTRAGTASLVVTTGLLLAGCFAWSVWYGRRARTELLELDFAMEMAAAGGSRNADATG